MQTGDLVLFEAFGPRDADFRPVTPTCWEASRLGLVLSVYERPDRYGDELSVMHEGERWSVPAVWCRRLQVKP